MLRLVNFIKTIYSFISKVMMEVWHLMPIGGMLEGLSTINTLMKELDKTRILSKSEVISILSPSSLQTPICRCL